MALTPPLPGRGLAVLVALALVGPYAGCKPKNTETPAPVTDAVEPEPAQPEPPTPVASPQALYAECEQRVEGPQKDAECTTDADCATAGCGNEVCTTTAEKVNVMTTCEDKLCFKVLDACGCHEGRCTWTVKAEVPIDQVPTTPGGSLPPTTPQPEGSDVPAEGGEPAPDPAPAPEPAPAPVP